MGIMKSIAILLPLSPRNIFIISLPGNCNEMFTSLFCFLDDNMPTLKHFCLSGSSTCLKPSLLCYSELKAAVFWVPGTFMKTSISSFILKGVQISREDNYPHVVLPVVYTSHKSRQE